jgi:hypothetical protein
VVTPEHLELFSAHLSERGADLKTLSDSRQLLALDAAATMAEIMRDGLPDWNLFQSTIGVALAQQRFRALVPA